MSVVTNGFLKSLQPKLFRKRGRTTKEENIEVSDIFNYLDVVFNFTGLFTLNQAHLTGKALRAMNFWSCKCREFDLNTKKIKLFDAFVGSFLSYACEIFGFTNSKYFEHIHLKFCKMLLQVKCSTCQARRNRGRANNFENHNN